MAYAVTSKRKSEGNDNTEKISDQIFKKLNAIYFIPDDRIKWEIRILQGAKEQGNQWGPFHRASNIINTKLIKLTYLNVTDVKDNKWNPHNLVDWLLGGNLHVIITHPHQGMPQNWSMVELYKEFDRLYYHEGFPNESKLSCPIFTQDKYSYLEPLFDDEICLRTLKVDLVELMDYDRILLNVTKYMRDNTEGIGAVIKAPYSTNRCRGIEKTLKYGRTPEVVLGMHFFV